MTFTADERTWPRALLRVVSPLRRPFLALVAVSLLTVGVLATAGAPTRAADGAPDVEFLTGRSTSPDDIRTQLRLRLDGTGPTHVMNIKDVDHLQLAKLTFAPDELVNWHTHPGPVIVIVEEGILTVTSARDCVARDYGPQEVYIEQGPGDVLRVSNETVEPTVIYALFLEVPAVGPITIPEPAPDC
jgi:hypothetical protein